MPSMHSLVDISVMRSSINIPLSFYYLCFPRFTCLSNLWGAWRWAARPGTRCSCWGLVSCCSLLMIMVCWDMFFYRNFFREQIDYREKKARAAALDCLRVTPSGCRVTLSVSFWLEAAMVILCWDVLWCGGSTYVWWRYSNVSRLRT